MQTDMENHYMADVLQRGILSPSNKEILLRIASEHPEYRKLVVPLLRRLAEEAPAEEEAETKEPSKKNGPPPKWDEFLKARYEGGKKKVPNPNPDTRDRFKQVSLSTAAKFKPFMKKLMEEYRSGWLTVTMVKKRARATSLRRRLRRTSPG